MAVRTSVAAGDCLVRRLGLWSSIGIVIGITIGSGIFRTPATIAARVPDPSMMLAVWLLGGIFALCGALSVAELAAALPQTGGWYVFLREGWGRPTAFVFGWAQLILIRASVLGGVSTVFAEYLMRSAGVDPAAHAADVHYLAALAIACAAAANIRGVRLGAAIMGLSTVAKFGALVVLTVAAFTLGSRAGATTSHFTAHADVQGGLFGLALISVLWAYDGFSDIAFAAGEVIDPQRTLPRAIIGGTVAIVAIYLAANAAYLYVNPIDAIARSPLVAADTMNALFGGVGVSIVSIVVAISTFGSLNGAIFGAPRIFFALAEDGMLWRPIARVHPKYGTPHVAILLSAALGIGFVLTRTFEQLTDTFVLALWPFYAIGIAALYKLRVTRPDLPRPYKVPGYPVVPAVFIAAVVYLVANALVTDPVWTGVTFGIILAGVPVYYIAVAKSQDPNPKPQIKTPY